MTDDEDSDSDIDLLGDRHTSRVADDGDDGDAPASDADTDEESTAGGTTRQRVDEPLGDLAQRINEEDRAALEATEDVFEEVNVSDVDVDSVWEELEAGTGPTGETLDADEDVRRISKSICHNCPHFGEPPELACTHEGTTIREMPDNEHFVVVECPVVNDQITEDPR